MTCGICGLGLMEEEKYFCEVCLDEHQEVIAKFLTAGSQFSAEDEDNEKNKMG